MEPRQISFSERSSKFVIDVEDYQAKKYVRLAKHGVNGGVRTIGIPPQLVEQVAQAMLEAAREAESVEEVST